MVKRCVVVCNGDYYKNNNNRYNILYTNHLITYIIGINYIFQSLRLHVIYSRFIFKIFSKQVIRCVVCSTIAKEVITVTHMKAPTADYKVCSVKAV